MIITLPKVGLEQETPKSARTLLQRARNSSSRDSTADHSKLSSVRSTDCVCADGVLNVEVVPDTSARDGLGTVVGEGVGTSVGNGVGTLVGDRVGTVVGEGFGISVGDGVGTAVDE